jgi:hypothetical protein
MNSIERTIYRDGTHEMEINGRPVSKTKLILSPKNGPFDPHLSNYPIEFPKISMESYRLGSLEREEVISKTL